VVAGEWKDLHDFFEACVFVFYGFIICFVSIVLSFIVLL
jgi:hypothetical protein